MTALEWTLLLCSDVPGYRITLLLPNLSQFICHVGGEEYKLLCQDKQYTLFPLFIATKAEFSILNPPANREGGRDTAVY